MRWRRCHGGQALGKAERVVDVLVDLLEVGQVALEVLVLGARQVLCQVHC